MAATWVATRGGGAATAGAAAKAAAAAAFLLHTCSAAPAGTLRRLHKYTTSKQILDLPVCPPHHLSHFESSFIEYYFIL